MRELTHKSPSTILKSVWVLQIHWQTRANFINAGLKGQLQAMIYDVCLLLEGVSSTFLKQAFFPPTGKCQLSKGDHVILQAV